MPDLPSLACLLFALALPLPAGLAHAQEATSPIPGGLTNGDFELADSDGLPTGWGFGSQAESTIDLVDEDVFEGTYCALVDAPKAMPGGGMSATLVRSLEAAPWRGERVRFRAAVRTEDLTTSSTVQLWFRVDGAKDENGRSPTFAFDNMGDRPIRTEEWQQFEISLDVAEEAEQLYIGALLIGKGRFWIDAATLEIVGEQGEALATAAPPAELPDGQEAASPRPEGLSNGGFELAGTDGIPTGWGFRSQTDGTIRLVDEDVFEGVHCALIDTPQAMPGGGMSCNLIRSLDATPWRGERVRFRAAVRTEDLTTSSKVQLWFRVDGAKGKNDRSPTLAFDNMGDRPIRTEEWKPFEIVLDVAEDAEQLYIGAFLIGEGRFWIDAATLESVGEQVEATAEKATASSGSGMDSTVRKAFNEAGDAPQQPFWTWWLALPGVAILLFLLGMAPARPRASDSGAVADAEEQPAPSMEQANTRFDLGFLRSFALRFTLLYWLLYCLPGPFASFLSGISTGIGTVAEWTGVDENVSEQTMEFAMELSTRRQEFGAWVSHYVAETFFGIEEALVPPNGSGDTTQGYFTILAYFGFAAVAALLATLFLRRTRTRDLQVDLLRSLLRYVLALAMIGYGLAKVMISYNQFPEVADWRLQRTWGETSPMGVVWAFMGSSRPYTIFAGLCEVLAGVLLIWRRTQLLGALAAVAVLTNIVLLNYCYDVPVKIYSTHLMVMGMLILLPDLRRLASLFLLCRNSTDPGTPNAWARIPLGSLRWIPKILIVFACFALPIYGAAEEHWDAHFGAGAETQQADESTDSEVPEYLLTSRGYRWINEVPFNR